MIKFMRTREIAAYFRGCSLDSMFCPGPVEAVSKVRKTRRSATPDRIKTSPMRKRRMVSGRFDSDVRIICTHKGVQTVGQTRGFCNSLKMQRLTWH